MKKRLLSLVLVGTLLFASCKNKGEGGGSVVPSGMPDYSAYETERVMWIGGWNPPPPRQTTSVDDPTYDFQTEERYLEMADCGINVGICVYEEKNRDQEAFFKALDYADAAGIRLLVMDYDVRPETYDPNTTAEDLLRITASYNEHPAFLGHHVYDEPSVDRFDAIGALKKTYEKAFPDKYFFVNLFPSYASSGSLGTTSGYEYYLQNFIDRVSPDLLSVDYYPLKGSTAKPVLYTGLLADYELYAENAKLYDIPFFAFIGSMGFNSSIKQPNIQDLRFMINAALMFGADGINHFCYWQPYDSVIQTENMHAMIMRDGTVTELWKDCRTVNREVLAFDHVLLSFDWQGIMLSNGTDNGNKISTSFRQVRRPMESHPRISSLTSSKDLSVGVFRDGSGYDGFYMMNYNNPGNLDEVNAFTVTFNDADRAIVWYRGESSVVTLDRGSFTKTLDPGDAVFVIPIKG